MVWTPELPLPAPTVPAWAGHITADTLTDLSPNTDDVFDGAKASAVMVGVEGSSFFRLQIKGIGRAAGNEYPAHLHKGPCVAGQGALALGHYNTQQEAGFPAPWKIGTTTRQRFISTSKSIPIGARR